MIVFTVMILSVLLYGCESWALSAAQMLRLEVFMRGCLRQILGLRSIDGVSDADLYARCGGVERIEQHWRRRALRWLGHLGRMDASRLAKKLLWATFMEGERRRGRRAKSLPEMYAEQLQYLSPQLAEARKTWRAARAKQGESLFGFSWLDACHDRDAWRKLVG